MTIPVLTASDVRAMFRGLDQIKRVTDCARMGQMEIPFDWVLASGEAEAVIRETLLRVALREVEVEA